MNVRQILEYPNKALKQTAEKVEEITPEIEQLCSDLVATARAFGAQGLAATQIGENKRIFVIKNEHTDEYRVCINPVFLDSDDKEMMTEGCLSFPGVLAKVERSVSGDASYMDLSGNYVSEILTGVEAVAFQHELDHLDGILFIERMGQMQKRITLKRLDKIRRRTKNQLKQLEKMIKRSA